jgi:hypothetical protein
MLKVLLARHIPEHYLSAPRGDYQGATQLAAAADVSVMSAFRFIEQFSKAGFLEEQRLGLRAVRIEELMNRCERLAAMSHAQLVEEVTRRREVRRIKGLGAKEYRAEVAIGRAAGEQPVAQPKMASRRISESPQS